MQNFAIKKDHMEYINILSFSVSLFLWPGASILNQTVKIFAFPKYLISMQELTKECFAIDHLPNRRGKIIFPIRIDLMGFSTPKY